VAGADQHAAFARDQREDVAGVTIWSGPLDASIATEMVRARSPAEMPVVTPSLASIETVKGGLVARAVVAAHQAQAELIDARFAQRQADQAPAMLGHEVDRVRSRHLGRDDEIALILAVVIVDQDEHAAVAGFIDDLLGARHHAASAAGQEPFELEQGLRSRVPVRLAQAAQAVRVEAGGTGEPGARHFTGRHQLGDSVDQDRAHARLVSHCPVMSKISITSR
jgi:hypothetical protein